MVESTKLWIAHSLHLLSFKEDIFESFFEALSDVLFEFIDYVVEGTFDVSLDNVGEVHISYLVADSVEHERLNVDVDESFAHKLSEVVIAYHFGYSIFEIYHILNLSFLPSTGETGET